MRKVTKSYLKDLTYQVNGAAIEVHKALGPGLLESVYHKCLKQELTLRNIKFQSELNVAIIYKGIEIDANLRCDLLIEDCLVAELKTADTIIPIHEAQLLTYMKLLKIPKGVIYNFKVMNLYQDGQKTFVNEFFRDLPL
jgi:GxxExxY protein